MYLLTRYLVFVDCFLYLYREYISHPPFASFVLTTSHIFSPTCFKLIYPRASAARVLFLSHTHHDPIVQTCRVFNAAAICVSVPFLSWLSSLKSLSVGMSFITIATAEGAFCIPASSSQLRIKRDCVSVVMMIRTYAFWCQNRFVGIAFIAMAIVSISRDLEF